MQRKDTFWTQVGRYTSLGFLLPASTLAGYVIGYLLDKALGTGFLRIVFLLLGIAGGFIELIRTIQADTRDE